MFNNFDYAKALKPISVFTFLFISGIEEVSPPIFAFLFLYVIDFFQSFCFESFGVSWETGGFAFSTIGTLIVFGRRKVHKDRYFFLFCFIALTVAGMIFTGVLNPINYKRITIWVLLPSIIFLISSVSLIVLNFRKPIDKIERL